MRYREAFAFVFRGPHWLPNLLILALLMLVPLVGPIVAFGYHALVIESLRGGRDDAEYHRLDIDQLGEYLLRGLRVFLVSLLLLICMLPVYVGAMFLMIGSSLLGATLGSEGGDQAGTLGAAIGCAGTGLAVGLLVVAALVLALLLLPLQLRAALNPDLAALFSPSYVVDFLRRMRWECLLFYVVLLVASIPIMLAGMLLLLVGMFVAAAYLQLVQAHLLAQLADLYEARGGAPIAGPTRPSMSPPPLPA